MEVKIMDMWQLCNIIVLLAKNILLFYNQPAFTLNMKKI